jgi:hypothetical protein
MKDYTPAGHVVKIAPANILGPNASKLEWRASGGEVITHAHVLAWWRTLLGCDRVTAEYVAPGGEGVPDVVFAWWRECNSPL